MMQEESDGIFIEDLYPFKKPIAPRFTSKVANTTSSEKHTESIKSEQVNNHWVSEREKDSEYASRNANENIKIV